MPSEVDEVVRAVDRGGDSEEHEAGLELEGVQRAQPGVLTIRMLYQQVKSALRDAFPTPVWVSGELRSISRSSQGHHYLELADPEGAERGGDAVLRVVCWRTQWQSVVGPDLVESGISLEEGMVVRVLGDVSVYDRGSQINLRMQRIDTEALLGKLAAQKARLLRKLEAEGLFELNRSVPMPEVALRIGLVASVGTEGYRDFTGQVQKSGFGFVVLDEDATVQGAEAPASISAGIRRVWDRSPDLIVVVRGGGSRGDLSAFDSEEVARAVAASPVPVWTGIGHTGDKSVADLVAHSSFITPTACGEEVVARVRSYWAEICSAGERITIRARTEMERSAEALASAVRMLAARGTACLSGPVQYLSGCRRSLATAAEFHLRGAQETLYATSARAARLALPVTRVSRDDLAASTARLVIAQGKSLDAARAHLASVARLLDAYDYHRQLERGYTLTRGSDGKLLRSATGLALNDRVTTQVADGTFSSVIDSVQVAADDGSPVTGLVAAEQER